MKWDYWLSMYIGTHCAARGLASSTMAAYRAQLDHFRAWVQRRLDGKDPDEVTPADVLA